jgi:hypothetical protein
VADEADHQAWIFVSHSSHDIERVREVRNYLEEKGASPLLFHLRALENPDEFWPLIEREIASRNFFLYCESEAASASEWVQRERAAVEAIRRERRIRIGEVRVDGDELDTEDLDAFLARTRVFPSYAVRDRPLVEPFLDELERAGFQVFRPERDVAPFDSWADVIDGELDRAAEEGWVVAFVSPASVGSEWLKSRAAASRGARIVPVMLEPVRPPAPLDQLQWFIAWEDPATSPRRLAEELLAREP